MHGALANIGLRLELHGLPTARPKPSLSTINCDLRPQLNDTIGSTLDAYKVQALSDLDWQGECPPSVDLLQNHADSPCCGAADDLA